METGKQRKATAIADSIAEVGSRYRPWERSRHCLGRMCSSCRASGLEEAPGHVRGTAVEGPRVRLPGVVRGGADRTLRFISARPRVGCGGSISMPMRIGLVPGGESEAGHHDPVTREPGGMVWVRVKGRMKDEGQRDGGRRRDAPWPESCNAPHLSGGRIGGFRPLRAASKGWIIASRGCPPVTVEFSEIVWPERVGVAVD